jgi:uncharacterized paraquat-inducible protein A
MSARVTWTPPRLACPDCECSAPSPHWAIEEQGARCPHCAAIIALSDIDVVDW